MFKKFSYKVDVVNHALIGIGDGASQYVDTYIMAFAIKAMGAGFVPDGTAIYDREGIDVVAVSNIIIMEGE